MSTVAPALRQPLAVPRRLLRLRSDAALAERFSAGDEAAFAVLYERYRPSVIAVCMGVLGSSHDAEDAAQDTFASLASALRTAPPRELKPWLIRVSRNAAIDVARRRKRTVVTDEELVDVAAAPGGVAKAELESIMAGIRELPESQRTALLMRELAGHSYLEIAALLEVDEEAVRGLIARARVSLRAHREASELSCAAARESIAADPDGKDLSKAVKRHVRECPPCRAYRQALRDDARALRGLSAMPTGATVVGGGAAFGGLAAKGALLGGALTQVSAACAVSACAVGGVALLVPHAQPIVRHSAAEHDHRLLAAGAGHSRLGSTGFGRASARAAGPRGLFSGRPGTFALSRALGTAVSGRRGEKGLGLALLLGAGAANRTHGRGSAGPSGAANTTGPSAGAPPSGSSTGAPAASGAPSPAGPAGLAPGAGVRMPGFYDPAYGYWYPHDSGGRSPGAGGSGPADFTPPSGTAGSGAGSGGTDSGPAASGATSSGSSGSASGSGSGSAAGSAASGTGSTPSTGGFGAAGGFGSAPPASGSATGTDASGSAAGGSATGTTGSASGTTGGTGTAASGSGTSTGGSSTGASGLPMYGAGSWSPIRRSPYGQSEASVGATGSTGTTSSSGSSSPATL